MFLVLNFVYLFILFLLVLLRRLENLQLFFFVSFMFFLPFMKNMDEIFEGIGGVHIVFDDTSRLFVLMNVLVFLGVSLKMRGKKKIRFPFVLTFITLNFLYASADLFNIYVLLELLSLETMILISSGGKVKQFWSSVKYMIFGSVGMNIYLLGVGMVYMQNGTFDLTKILRVSNVSLVLIFTGLLVRTGFFLYGMWLPSAHSSAESEISAILSGVIVKGGIFSILRILSFEPFSSIIPWITKVSAISSFLAVIFAITSKSFKRMLANHTLSQLGFIMSNVETAPMYAFAHALFKSWLFILADELPSERFDEMGKRLNLFPWIFLILGSLSIIGIPGTIGYAAKSSLFKNTCNFERFFLTLASIGTSVSFSKLISRRPKISGWGGIKENLHNLYFSILVIGGGVVLFEFRMKSFIQSFLLFIVGFLLHRMIGKNLKELRNPLERIEVNLFVISTLILGMILWLIS